MSIYKRKFIGVSTIMLAAIITTIYLFTISETSYAYRQVQKIAPVTDNFLLLFPEHISKSIRPTETFTFPIAEGAIGPVKNLYSGTLQYPFYCMTVDSGLGQPLVDNQSGYGVPIYRSLKNQDKVIGYSKDCSTPTRLSYFRINPDNSIEQLSAKMIKLMRGFTPAEKIIRVEQGTINRFIYTIVMLIKPEEIGQRLAQSQWNKKLIYQFNGGSGIGYRQGKQKANRVIERLLAQVVAGYAVISSSGNKTSYTYNMLLAEDTARRVKKQFTSLYGQPLYTVGVGGSGGGLAQYLIAQNSQGILDGLIPQYSYPDMITTTTYALDCDLLNNYYTFRAKNKHLWQDWHKRQLIEGLNSKNDYPQRSGFLQPMNQLMAGFVPSFPDGNSECINGYFGLSSFINNPQQGFIRDFFKDSIVKSTYWSYWQDMVEIFGQDTKGMGLSTWDNVGVQYGLVALTAGKISMVEFFDINRKIGGWKPQQQMEKEWLLTPFGKKTPLWLTLWGNQNITEVDDGLAPRHQGSTAAMQAAYRSGQIFIGKVSLPIIDVRHYLEDQLDMHHLSASFYSRLRIKQYNGHSNNHVIWVADKNFDLNNLVFEKMDEWLLAIKKNNTEFNREEVVAAHKPKQLSDACFDANGQLIDNSVGTWNDKWNEQTEKKGKCAKTFPIFSNSRIQAGSQWQSDIFKCQLISVSQAIANGTYGDIDMTEHQQTLEEIFPQGVCDYHQTDVGRPADI
ncbi:MAG: DUF6351 family protein [Thalassotalea sp.]